MTFVYIIFHTFSDAQSPVCLGSLFNEVSFPSTPLNDPSCPMLPLSFQGMRQLPFDFMTLWSNGELNGCKGPGNCTVIRIDNLVLNQSLQRIAGSGYEIAESSV